MTQSLHKAWIGLIATCVVAVGPISCRGPGMAGAAIRPVSTAPRVVMEGEGIDPVFVPALRMVRLALEANDLEGARRILDRHLPRAPEGRTRAMFEAFERIVAGRELSAAVEARLVLREEGPRSLRLSLELTYVGEDGYPERIEVRPGPGVLRIHRSEVTSQGREVHGSESHSLGDQGPFVLLRGERLNVSLRQFTRIAPGRTGIAVRQRFDVDFRSGEVRTGEGLPLPVQDLAVRSVADVIWNPELGQELTAENWLAGLELEIVSPVDLLNRAVRVAPEDQVRALRVLATQARQFPAPRVAALVPALRWLSEATDLGADPRDWQEALIRLDEDTEEVDLVRPDLELGGK